MMGIESAVEEESQCSAFANRLRCLVEKHGYTINSLSKALGKPGLRNKFSRRNSHSLKLSEITLILNFLGESTVSYFRLDCSSSEVSLPVQLLRRHRMAMSPKSRTLRRWIQEAESLVLMGSWDIPSGVEEINHLRMTSPHNALLYVERVVDSCLVDLYGSRRVTPAKVVSFVGAVGCWASVVRCLGGATDASFALELAFSVHKKGSGALYASLLHRTALTLRDLAGYSGCVDALPLLREGAVVAQLLSDEDCLLAQYTAMATIAYDADEPALALNAAKVASSYAKSGLDRVALAQVACSIHCDEGRFLEAQAALVKVQSDLAEVPKSAQDLLSWIQARACVGLGELDVGYKVMSSLVDSPASEILPLTRIRIFCDLARVLRRLGRDEEVERRAAMLTSSLPSVDLSQGALLVVNRLLLTIRHESGAETEAIAKQLRFLMR